MSCASAAVKRLPWQWSCVEKLSPDGGVEHGEVIMNEQTSETASEQAASFQKIWMETMSKTMQSAFTFTPNSPPPEIMREIRSGIFQALAESWEKFLRSPEFLQSTKQWMEQAVTFRKASNVFLGKVRHEMQAPSTEDVDTIMLAVRHIEKRVLDRIDELSEQLNASNHGRPRSKKPARATKAGTRAAHRTPRKSSP